jgi:hypothetical protein
MRLDRLEPRVSTVTYTSASVSEYATAVESTCSNRLKSCSKRCAATSHSALAGRYSQHGMPTINSTHACKTYPSTCSCNSCSELLTVSIVASSSWRYGACPHVVAAFCLQATSIREPQCQSGMASGLTPLPRPETGWIPVDVYPHPLLLTSAVLERRQRPCGRHQLNPHT